MHKIVRITELVRCTSSANPEYGHKKTVPEWKTSSWKS